MLRWLHLSALEPEQVRALSYFRLGPLKRALPTGLLVTLDALLQPTGQLAQLSPSIFVRARARGESPLAAPDQFFRCPACGGTQLNHDGGRLDCVQCGRRWPIRDGIYDFKQPE